MYVLDGHPGVVTHLAMSPQCRHIAAAVGQPSTKFGWENPHTYQLWLWDVAERQREMIFWHPRGNPFSKLLFTEGGDTLVVAGHRAIFLWDVLAHRDAGTLDLLDARQVFDVVHAVSRDVVVAVYAFASPARHPVEVWEWELGSRRRRQSEPTADVAAPRDAAVFAGSPPRLVVCQQKGMVLSCEPGASQPLVLAQGPWQPPTSSCKPLIFTRDGQMLGLCSREDVALIAMKSPENPRELPVAGRVLAFSFAPDSRSIATGSEDGIVTLWDVGTGREMVRFDWQLGPVHSLAFAPDGMTLAAGYAGKIVVWDVEPT